MMKKIFSTKKKNEERLTALEKEVKQLKKELKEKDKKLSDEEKIKNLKTDMGLIKTIVQMVNKSNTLSVTLQTVEGDVLTVSDKVSSPSKDYSMLGF